MTPEQLAHIRQWAEWGESPTPETTIALLDHVDEVNDAANAFAQAATSLTADNVRLGDKLQAVRELHQERPNSTSALYPNPLCSCGKEYPCPTIQALEGDPDA